MTGTALDRLLESGTILRFAPGETIIRQGDLSNHVLRLATGAAAEVLHGAGEARLFLAARTAPEIVGEQAVTVAGPRFAQVVALTEVTAHAVPGEAVRDLMERDLAVALAVFTVISQRLRESDQARLELASRSASQRLAARLLSLAPRIGTVDEETGAVRLPLNQQQLAEWIGASREAVVRTLVQLRDAGAVTTSRGAITLHRLDVLREQLA